MHCTYCGEHLESGKGLLVTWQDGIPRPIFACATQAFCNERCLYKYLANQLREPQVAVQLSPGRILRVLTSLGVFLIKGDSWKYFRAFATEVKKLAILNAEGTTVADFPHELIQGVIVEENFFGEEESKVEQDQTQA